MDRFWRVSVPAALVAALVLLLPACGAPAANTSPAPSPTAVVATVAPAPSPTAVAASPSSPCGLPPVVAPTPAADPGYAELDPTTGLHMTGRMQLLEPDTYRLKVSGLVDRPLELTYDAIRCLPRIEASPVLTCPGFFVDHATWAGTPIAEVLALAGVQEGADQVEFTGADGYSRTFSLERALDPANYLAYEWNGEPLPRLHGFPLRVVAPGAQGNQWTKWLVEIEVK
jgi:DMSO/TMAO reductase YedYZ molybdopterin-dependent catalytic subunit